jgi:hypothetical protein
VCVCVCACVPLFVRVCVSSGLLYSCVQVCVRGDYAILPKIYASRVLAHVLASVRVRARERACLCVRALSVCSPQRSRSNQTRRLS